MGDSQGIVRPEDMATTSTAVTTVTPQLQEDPVQPVAVITLRQGRAQTQTRKKVVWTEDTVDNENMNKKKSKCCCIYEKPRRFGESDSESSDDECEHCYGHVEQRKPKQQDQQATTTDVQDSTSAEPSVSIRLPAGEPPDKQAPPS
ncbi:uncharacterized protein ACR2FA_006856 [Aphomia sociella]